MKKTALIKILLWLKASAENSKDGPSSKKLTAFWALVVITTPVVWLWAFWAFIYDDWKYLPEVLLSMLGFVAAGLGINSYEKTKAKNETPLPPDPAGPGQ